MKRLTAGILAHVDAGKTTLSEALLYNSGAIRRLGRVDKGDAFLDTSPLEKKRGITIFSKQAILKWDDLEITLLDTPGHVDFSAEMERTLSVLDYCILVISGSDGVQSHTRTLWKLLKRYDVPTFIFVNKMDLTPDFQRDERRTELMAELQKELDANCVDFAMEDRDEFAEACAMCREDVLENFLETGEVVDDDIKDLIIERKLFPVYFGAALKQEGIQEFIEGIKGYTDTPWYDDEFGATVYKITRDDAGNRLTHVKITGGSIKVRDELDEEKITQIRVYNGEKFEAVKEAEAGMVCALMGLTKSMPGQGLGSAEGSLVPVLEPVLNYRVVLPRGVDAAQMLPKFLELEEEEPELHIVWEEEKKEIHAQIMGEIQMEILKSLIAERFDVPVSFGERSILYKETIKSVVEGVGHYEPLRHYAEVHLIMEPGEPGSGLVFDTCCSEDLLAKNWQRLIMTHLEEKEHRGVLIGAPITDMKITIAAGRAHIKHTVGGDFRQATYRAIRHGLMYAVSGLLEPYYGFRLEIPDKFIGRAMTDLERMGAKFETPEMFDGKASITGTCPVSTLDGYQSDVTAYTGGLGSLSLVLSGYGPCHNEEEVVLNSGYDPNADLRNPTGSVFTSHGAGFYVNWDEVTSYMQVESVLDPARKTADDSFIYGARSADGAGGDLREEGWIGTDEIDSILSRTFNANKKNEGGRRKWSRRNESAVKAHRDYSGGAAGPIKKKGPQNPNIHYLLVDGYNVIFSWEKLRELSKVNIDSARDELIESLSAYQGAMHNRIIAVFDAYKVQGHKTEIYTINNIHVVFTKEAETADQYIEKFAHENGEKYDVAVATSDHLEQVIIRGQGCRLISARELETEIERTLKDLREQTAAPEKGARNFLFDGISEEDMAFIQKMLVE